MQGHALQKTQLGHRKFDMLWKFMTYVSPSGRTETQATIDRYDDKASASFERAVAHLSVSSIDQWNKPFARKLKSRDKLFEICYKANQKETRALGSFGPSPGHFSITLICTHKTNVYTPPDAFETAENRFAQIRAGSATTVPLQIDGEDFPEI